MRKMYKYGVCSKTGLVKLPSCAVPLKFAFQKGKLCLWAEVFETSEDLLCEKRFFIVGTGHPIIEESSVYIDTVFDGEFVWHIYECTGDFRIIE